MLSETESDFAKARNKALFNEIQHFLKPEEAAMISFRDIKELLKPQNQTYIGMQVIPIEKIVGSEGRYKDFDNQFFPKNTFIKERWEHVDEAVIKDIILPPIKVYELGGLYFVRDGNHRVSVAKSKGVEFIDAEVVSLQSEIRLPPVRSLTGMIKEIINYEKRNFYFETSFGDITDYWCLDFSRTGRYDVIYNHILTHKYYLNQNKEEEVSMEEAITSWFQTVYMPFINQINAKHILKSFPKRTSSDLYVWMVRYWDCLKQKYGESIDITKAVEDFEKVYKIPFIKRVKNHFKRIVLRKEISNTINDNDIKL